MEVLSGVGGDDVSLSTSSCSGCDFFFFFPKNLRTYRITNYCKHWNGTKQVNRQALVISVTRRRGKNNTDVEFATNYSDSAHIWAYAVRKARPVSAQFELVMLYLWLLADMQPHKNHWGYFHHEAITFDFFSFFFLRHRDPGPKT